MALSSNLAILAKGHSNARSYLHQTKGNDWGEEVKQRNLTLKQVCYIQVILPLPLSYPPTYTCMPPPLSNPPTYTFMPLSPSLTQPHTL